MPGMRPSRQTTDLAGAARAAKPTTRTTTGYNRLIIFNRTCAASTSWRWAAIAQR